MINNIFIKSGFNFFKSILKVEDVIEFAIKNNINQIALIEDKFLYSSASFIRQAKKNNLIPIVGLRVSEKHIFLAKNFEGYKKLVSLSSILTLEESLDLNNFKSDSNLFYFEENNFKYAVFEQDKDIKTFKIFQKIASIESEINSISLESQTNNWSEEQINLLNQINSIKFSFDLVKVNYDQTLNFFNDANLELKKILEDKFKFFISENKIKNLEIYKDRLQFEFDVISKMNFSSYFLVVYDYINWAIEKGISIGPGRGSAPGSLISFLLGLSSINPVENDLLFERFLNQDRVSIPDIDIDFQDDKREEVIKYLVEKYSFENVSQIITFQTFQLKNSIKDISKVYGIPFSEVNKFTKLFVDKLTLKQNLNKKDVKDFLLKNPNYVEIIEHVKKIINLPRQTSIHAAGILISAIPIRNIIPVQRNNEMLLTQITMDYLEEEGLIKFDFLALKNLTILNAIFELIKRKDKKELSFISSKKDLNDEKVFNLLSEGKTLGLFQLESEGMKNTLKKVKINTFEDIVSVISLFRPGPQKNIDQFAINKQNQNKIDYLNPILEDILKNTYGIIVYQEQIMQIASKYANFTLSEADTLRRAISKKDNDKMEQLKTKFIDSSVNKKEAEKIFNLIYEFANYGFNRSHAFCYSVISYNFAWLKYYYPFEFALAYLTSVDKDKNKINDFLKENPNLKINPINFNQSKKSFSISKDELLLGFNSINGFGPELINKILLFKEKYGLIKNIYELLMLLNANNLSERNIQDLIKVGAFDDYNFSREGLLASLKDILKFTKILYDGEKINFDLIDQNDLPKINNLKDENNLSYIKTLIGINLNEGQNG